MAQWQQSVYRFQWSIAQFFTASAEADIEWGGMVILSQVFETQCRYDRLYWSIAVVIAIVLLIVVNLLIKILHWQQLLVRDPRPPMSSGQSLMIQNLLLVWRLR